MTAASPPLVWTLVILLLASLAAGPAHAQVVRKKWTSGARYLKIEMLDNDLVHVEVSEVVSPSPPQADAIYTTQMISKTDYTGPTNITTETNAFQTDQLRVVVDPSTLAITLFDVTKSPQKKNTVIDYVSLNQALKYLRFTKEDTHSIYGLGSRFIDTYNEANSDYLNSDFLLQNIPDNTAYTGGKAKFGNCVRFLHGGGTGLAQFPVMYAVSATSNYAIFFDNVYRHEWTQDSTTIKADSWGDVLRFYILTGPNLPDLRTDYMELVGRPPVPPRKMFGLWVSKFGYKSWSEVDAMITSMDNANIPFDGVVLDLYWFGGNFYGSGADVSSSRMGSLTWDTTNFPSPETKTAAYRSRGKGLMVIEESYVSSALPEHTLMSSRNGLAKNAAGTAPAFVDYNPWWGKGGMIDWTNTSAANFWFDCKRCKLLSTCTAPPECYVTANTSRVEIDGFWTDLGEPEMFYDSNKYSGYSDPLISTPLQQHGDVHNIYQLLWSKSIFDGFTRRNINRRPFSLARSGTAGIHRFGVAMWSGDIGSNLGIVANHYGNYKHLVMAGMDYYGADIGGFQRDQCFPAQSSCDINELYSQWLANAVWLDVPVRPHGWDKDGNYPTGPSQVGYVDSNRFNVNLRYQHIPYYYSLAFRAYLFGEPVIAPLFYYNQNDLNTRAAGHQFFVGRDLLVGISTTLQQRSRGIYLPFGTWANYHTHQFFNEPSGNWYNSVSQVIQASPLIITLPVFARAGAIIPKMQVNSDTKDAFGNTYSSSVDGRLILRIYPSTAGSSFILYEDDGQTRSYQTSNDYRQFEISQQLDSAKGRIIIRVGAAAGTNYTDAPTSRPIHLEVVYDAASFPFAITKATYNSNNVTKYANNSVYTQGAPSSGWTVSSASTNMLLLRTASVSVFANHSFCLGNEASCNNTVISAPSVAPEPSSVPVPTATGSGDGTGAGTLIISSTINPSVTPSSNTPAASSNTPAASSNTPAASSNTPAASSNTPAASSNTPVASSNTPVVSSNTPVASSNTPVVSSNTPVASSNTPVASSNTPAASSTQAASSTVGGNGNGDPSAEGASSCGTGCVAGIAAGGSIAAVVIVIIVLLMVQARKGGRKPNIYVNPMNNIEMGARN